VIFYRSKKYRRVKECIEFNVSSINAIQKDVICLHTEEINKINCKYI